MSKMVLYPKEQLKDMLFLLAEHQKNIPRTQRRYAELYPDRRQPSFHCLKRLLGRFNDDGTVAYKKRVYQNFHTTNNENVVRLLEVITGEPEVSQRDVSQQIDISLSSVNRMVKKCRLHPYEATGVQEIFEDDHQRRIRFGQTILTKIDEDPTYLERILFTDESNFANNKIPNRHNAHFYSTVNPHQKIIISKQNHWSVNVWGGILGDRIIGPHFFNGNLNGAIYLDFLQNILPNLLGVPQDAIIFQQDGAPPHTTLAVRRFLSDTYENWIGNMGRRHVEDVEDGPIPWPARSPDLTPMDFFFWGHIKEHVYGGGAINNQEEMKHRIREAFNSVSPITLQAVRRSFRQRLEECIRQNGGHIENFL